MEQPVLEERLLALSPKWRIVAGGLLTLVSAVVTVELWGAGWVWYGAIFGVAFGPALCLSGLGELRRRAAFAVEVARAEGEWADLRRDIANWQRSGTSVARELQQRGYREYFVRRWIVARAAEEHEAGRDAS